jgi:RNA polymerase sigma-70 factor (ECF subfamily)
MKVTVLSIEPSAPRDAGRARRASPEPSDEALVARVALGDGRALGTLYDRHGAVAYSLARAITGDDRAAEDVVARAFADVMREAGRYRESRSTVLAWMLAMVRRGALDSRRDREPRDWTMGRDDGARATDLDALPALGRRAIELAYFGGRSVRELAAELGLAERHALALIRSAMDALRGPGSPATSTLDAHPVSAP